MSSTCEKSNSTERGKKKMKETCNKQSNLLLLRWQLHGCRGGLTLGRERVEKISHSFYSVLECAFIPQRPCVRAQAAIHPLLLNMCVSLSVCLPYLFGLRVSVCLSICFPAQSVCQSVIFCLQDKEAERMCDCVCVCLCVCSKQIHLKTIIKMAGRYCHFLQLSRCTHTLSTVY